MIIVRNFRARRMFMLFAVLLFIVGCMPEQKIGSEYLSKRSNMTLVLRAPKWVKMVNLAYDSIQDGSEMTQRERDSVKYYHSKILQDLNDSILIGNYIKNLKESFESQGYKTYLASANETVFPIKGNAFLINIGQIEVDENKIPIRDETQFNRKLYGADYDLAKIELCCWIEVSKIENSIALLPRRLLYDADEKKDDDTGYFQWDAKGNKMNYVLTLNEMLPENVYTMAALMGTDHGIRLNDFLLNEYIGFALPQKKDRVLLGVNPILGKLFRVYSPPFKEIHE